MASAVVAHYQPEARSRELLDALQAAELHAIETLGKYGLLEEEP